MHFPFYLKRMINLQGRGYNTTGNTHNPDAISAVGRKEKNKVLFRKMSVTSRRALGSNNQAAGRVSPSLRL